MVNDKAYWLPIFLNYRDQKLLIEVLLDNGDKLKGKVSDLDDADGDEEMLVVMDIENRSSIWNKFTFDQITDVKVFR